MPPLPHLCPMPPCHDIGGKCERIKARLSSSVCVHHHRRRNYITMMSLVRMALLLLSSWLVCNSFISTIPAVSSATRLYSRRQSSAHQDRNDDVLLDDDDDDLSRISADYQSNSLPLFQELPDEAPFSSPLSKRSRLTRDPSQQTAFEVREARGDMDNQVSRQPSRDPRRFSRSTPRMQSSSSTISPYLDNSRERSHHMVIDPRLLSRHPELWDRFRSRSPTTMAPDNREEENSLQSSSP